MVSIDLGKISEMEEEDEQPSAIFMLVWEYLSRYTNNVETKSGWI